MALLIQKIFFLKNPKFGRNRVFLKKVRTFHTHSIANWPTSRDFENTMIFQIRFRETSSFCLLEKLIIHLNSMATLIIFGFKKVKNCASLDFPVLVECKKRTRWGVVFFRYFSREAKLLFATCSDGILLNKSNKNSWFMKEPRYYKN